MAEHTFSFEMIGKTEVYKASVCVSAFSLVQLINMRKEFLHPDEESLYNSYSVIEKQFSFLQSRYAAKKALIQTIHDKVALKEIKIEHGIFFQPIIRSAFFHNKTISLSHSGNLATAIVVPEELTVGIDVEFIDLSKNWADILPLSDFEKDLATQIDPNKLILMWSSKEALAKALKVGFTADLQIFEISNIEKFENYYECHFRFFMHLKACVWIINGYCFAIAMPQKLKLDLDLKMKL